MPSADDVPRFRWVTRGRTWGFRFLRRGEFADPLKTYEQIFSPIADQPEAWYRVGDKVALRFPDPESRSDESGRGIRHDVVLFDSWADGIDSIDTGRDRIWPEVARGFEEIWANGSLPSPERQSAQSTLPRTSNGSRVS